MGCTRNRGLAIPALAERARTLAARGGAAALVANTPRGRLVPTMHRVYEDGSLLLLLPEESGSPALAELAPGGEVSTMVEVTDTAPVALRQPVRGLLWITGWLRKLAWKQARNAATKWAEHRPDPRLLDVGHTASLLWLRPAFAVFSDLEGSGWLTPADLAEAEPDPFCHLERSWLQHLDQAHPDVLRALASRILAPSHLGKAQVRPLGFDRLGLRLRIEVCHHAHDVRLAFHQQATTPAQLAIELQRLVSCSAFANIHRDWFLASEITLI
ncbi:MAG: DUF2470 domain-containing protein [Pseudonocardiales bacterium]